MRLKIPTLPISSLTVASVLVSLYITACAPTLNKNLESARMNYQQAASDPDLSKDAAADLFAAEKLLQKADAIWQQDRDSVETNHLAYLISRKIDFARAIASQTASKRNFDKLSSKKDEILLQAREAEIAKLKAKKVPQGILVTLGDVLFDTGRSTLKPGALQEIFPLVAYLTEHTETVVKIEGHTDSQGSASYNEELSEHRAEAVRDFLVSNGVASERINVQGMGENYPVATNATAAGRQQNRRVEVTITDSPRVKAINPTTSA